MLLGLIFFPLKVKWSLNSTLKKRKFKLISFFLQMLLFFSYIIPCSSWLFLQNEISDLCALHKPFKIFTFLYLIFCGSMMSLRHTVWFMYMTRIFKFDRYPYIYNREGTELHCLKVGILPLLLFFFFFEFELCMYYHRLECFCIYWCLMSTCLSLGLVPFILVCLTFKYHI